MPEEPPEEPPQRIPDVGAVYRPYVGVTRAEIVDPVSGERFEIRIRKQLTRGD